MYYFKVAISAVFVIEFFISLFYLLSLSAKVATRLIERKEAMKKSFIVSFLSIMFMLIVYLMWQDLSGLSLWSWMMLTILITGFSFFVGLLFSAALWKNKN